jgi:ribulose-phosphate 3-epimerase
MTVNPGFGGQSFIEGQRAKMREARALIDRSGRAIELEVDGGINGQTAALAVEAGADVLVAGTAAFAGGATRYRDNIAKLRGG